MKKIIILFVVLLSTFSFSYAASWECEYNPENGWSISAALWNCLQDAKLVQSWNLKVEWSDNWFSLKIQSLVNSISLYLWILAVFSIVLGWLMMTISAWEEEKIKKAKDIVKWWIIWFIWLISISAIINLVVRIMYSI